MDRLGRSVAVRFTRFAATTARCPVTFGVGHPIGGPDPSQTKRLKYVFSDCTIGPVRQRTKQIKRPGTNIMWRELVQRYAIVAREFSDAVAALGREARVET